MKTPLLSLLTGLAALSSLELVSANPAVTEGKLQAISSAGIAEQTIEIPSESADSRVLSLSSTSTLKLSFSVPGDSSSSTSYASLILSTLSPNLLSDALASPTNASANNLFRRANSQFSSVSIYLAPKKGGKYRWEWDLSTTTRDDILSLAKLGEGKVKAQIYLSAAGGEGTVMQDIATVQFKDEAYWRKEATNKKLPREWEMDRYSVREELGWTFQQPRKQVGSVKALFGLGLVLAPWLLLAGLTSQILPSLSIQIPTSSLPFLGFLTSLQASTITYWFGWITVWTFMPLVVGLGVLALLSGKKALSDRMALRVRGEGKGKEVEKMS